MCIRDRIKIIALRTHEHFTDGGGSPHIAVNLKDVGRMKVEQGGGGEVRNQGRKMVPSILGPAESGHQAGSPAAAPPGMSPAMG